jgi:hypothetical protein
MWDKVLVIESYRYLSPTTGMVVFYRMKEPETMFLMEGTYLAKLTSQPETSQMILC